MAFLDEDRILITERAGQLRLWDGQQLSEPVGGLPEVYFKGQGGLLDVELLEQLDTHSYRILLSYAQGTDAENALTVISATLQLSPSLVLRDIHEVLKVYPNKATPVHFGGRLALLPDGTLLVTSGEGFDYRESAQKKETLLGKILRVNLDGSIPDDNPFVANPAYAPEIFSVGHRNPQALFFDATRNWIVSHEHGPAGGDEINIIEAGHNYGWPVITNGKDYSGANISPFTEYQGMQPPFVDWTPSIAPSDMIVYRGNRFLEFKGDYLVTTLKTKELRWVDMQDNEVVSQANILPKHAIRYRAIEESAMGDIYLLSDDGRLLMLVRD